jgi:predicted SAM-dependent methyltransferase
MSSEYYNEREELENLLDQHLPEWRELYSTKEYDLAVNHLFETKDVDLFAELYVVEHLISREGENFL